MGGSHTHSHNTQTSNDYFIAKKKPYVFFLAVCIKSIHYFFNVIHNQTSVANKKNIFNKKKKEKNSEKKKKKTGQNFFKNIGFVLLAGIVLLWGSGLLGSH